MANYRSRQKFASNNKPKNCGAILKLSQASEADHEPAVINIGVEFATMRRFTVIFIIFVTLVLVACGGNENAPAGDKEPVDYGQKMYNGTTIGAASSPGCITCHSLEEGIRIVGPSHAGLGSRAATVVAGQTAAEYLKESIVNPDAHVTEGFAPGTMYGNYDNELSDEQIDALVAYMLTLK
jgi:mono/diheme cytochrome c family protein